jgi:hypothetical protein
MPSADEFGSLSQARAYIDTVREGMDSLGARELIAALDRVDRAYQEFPELALEQPPSCFSSFVIVLLDKITRSDNRVSLPEALGLLGRFRELRWEAIEPVVSALRQQGRSEAVVQVISTVLDRVTFDNESAAKFADFLADLVDGERPPEIGGSTFTELVRSARRRLDHPASGRERRGSREALVAMAERLRTTPPPGPAQPHRDRAWPSGRLSFDEFLLQWPCEIELPTELDEATFIDEAYGAILLRGPEVAERDQYLKLLRDGAVSREWVIEDLLGSEELHSLDRRLRVVCGGRVITEPVSSGQEAMPAVTWPSRSAG